MISIATQPPRHHPKPDFCPCLNNELDPFPKIDPADKDDPKIFTISFQLQILDILTILTLPGSHLLP